MFDHRLVRKINAGRCFALVGAGPSAEMGYPAWPKLAQDVVQHLRSAGTLSDEASYEKYLRNNKLPELFSQAERDLGSREALVNLIRSLIVPTGGTHYIYDLLANWPFACYLTTNWDDEISNRLQANRTFFTRLQNTKEDLSLIRHDTSGVIVKLHSDLGYPDRAVITSADYARLSGKDGAYFQERLRAIFQMFDVFIVGHSLADPDLRLILQTAKEMANPDHPVFMITADLTKAEEQELLERFNILALHYENPDGRHTQLRRVLSLMDKFIIPRRQRFDLKAIPYSAEDLEAAQAVTVYRRLTAADAGDMDPVSYLGPLILQALVGETKGLEIHELHLKSPLVSAAKTQAVKDALPSVLHRLEGAGRVDADGARYRLSAAGAEQIADLSRQRVLEEEQAYGQFLTELECRLGTTGDGQQRELVAMLKDTLVRVFKQRGLSIANAVFSGQSLTHDALSDVFHAISTVAATIPDREVALAFMEAAQVFLVQPNAPQKRYLASLSQGYFLYHLFGLDPTCAKIRRDIFQQTIWWCDSSTLLPILALGCANHEYANDLFRRLQNLQAFMLTTGRLTREVFKHVDWFVRLMEREGRNSSVVLAAATQKGTYKENLFLDGFIRMSAEGRVSKLSDYLTAVSSHGVTENAMTRALQDVGVRVVKIEELEGFVDADTRTLFELAHDIAEARARTATFRSEEQVEAEAEILLIIRKLQDGSYTAPVKDMAFERSYFLSQSRVLDRVPPAEPVSWTPEALYRYIMALPGEAFDPDLLQRCMLQEYFGAGVVLIDTPRYEQFFGPSINAATTTYTEERDRFLDEFRERNAKELDDAFQSVPDLEKPFFVQQMGWKLANKEREHVDATKRELELARKGEADAQAEIVRLKQERDVDWLRRRRIREQQLQAETRNLQDTKHQKKRLRQAKKRTRKGRR